MPSLDAAIRAKLASWGDDPCGYATCIVIGWSEMRAAIDAVLDLHPEDGGWCFRCITDVSVAYGGPMATFEPYPCPTVRAIAEKLGVEVDGG